MRNKMTRRSFIKKSVALGASTSIGSSGLSHLLEAAVNPDFKDQNIDVAVAVGSDYFKSTQTAIGILGGMSKFVPKNSRVLLLGNVWRVPGTYTKPDIFRAVARMCREAGAKKITCVSMMPKRNWEQTGNKAALEGEGVSLNLFDYKDYSQFTNVPIPKGIFLKKAEIIKEYFGHDVFINIPICKHHVDTVFSCTMKNLMGLNSYRNNRNFHIDETEKQSDQENYLAQCIADLNTIILPTLNVVDATEFIATNGPIGPGRIIKPMKVVAGFDRIAIDAYCIELLDKKPANVIKIRKGFEQGLGEIDLSKIRIHEEML